MCWLVRPIANLRNGYRQLCSVGKIMSVREESKYPDKTWHNALRSLQLLKENMELCAYCTAGVQNVFFIAWHALLNIIRLTVGRIIPTDGNLQVFQFFFRSRSIKFKFQISSLHPLSSLICETSSKNVHFIINPIYFNNDCL